MTTIEVYADVWCPFAHVGLRRLREVRDELGLAAPILVRAWPLELVNGRPQDAVTTRAHVERLRATVAPGLFAGFDPDRFPVSTLAALALAAAAYRRDPRLGEQVSVELRDLLFEEGADVADRGVLERVAERHDLAVRAEDRRTVLEEWHHGESRHVRGSPHVFFGDRDLFCPALDVSRDDAGLLVVADRLERLSDLLSPATS